MPLFDSIADRLLIANREVDTERAKRFQELMESANATGMAASAQYQRTADNAQFVAEKTTRLEHALVEMKRQTGAALFAAFLVAGAGLLSVPNAQSAELLVENLTQQQQQQQVFNPANPANPANSVRYEGEDIYTQAERAGFVVNRNLLETDAVRTEDIAYKRSTNTERFGTLLDAAPTGHTMASGIELQGQFDPVDFGEIKDSRAAASLLEDKLGVLNTLLQENNGKLLMKANGEIDLASIMNTMFANPADQQEAMKLMVEYKQIFDLSLGGKYKPSTTQFEKYSGIIVNIDTEKAKNNAEIQLVHWLTLPDLSKESRSMLLGNDDPASPEIAAARKSIETLTALARGTATDKSLSPEEQKTQQMQQKNVITWHMQEIAKVCPDVKIPEMFTSQVTTQSSMPLAEDITVGLQTPALLQKYNETVPQFYDADWMKDNRSAMKFLGEEKGMEKVRLGLEQYDQAVAGYVSGNVQLEPAIHQAATAMRTLQETGITADSVEAYRTLLESELAKSKCQFLTGESSSPLNDIAVGRDTTQVDVMKKDGKFKPLNAHVASLVAATSLRSLGLEPTPERVQLMGLTMQIETTGMMHDYQQGGAALGATQFEPLTVKDMFSRSLLTNQARVADMGAILTSMNVQGEGDFAKQLKANVASNITLNTQLAAVHYDLRKGLNPARLADVQGQAETYKEQHNTFLGAATVEGAEKAQRHFAGRAQNEGVIFESLVEKVLSGAFKEQVAPVVPASANTQTSQQVSPSVTSSMKM